MPPTLAASACAGGGVVAAVEPELPAGRQQLDQRAAREALQARRPARGTQALRDRAPVRREVAKRQRTDHREAGVVDLMAAGQHRQRQVQAVRADLDLQPLARCARPASRARAG